MANYYDLARQIDADITNDCGYSGRIWVIEATIERYFEKQIKDNGGKYAMWDFSNIKKTLEEAFNAGRTVINYKGERIYDVEIDDHTSAKYEDFDNWYRTKISSKLTIKNQGRL